MSPVLIDTNILIDHLKGKTAATELLKSLIKADNKLMCSIITRIELLAGMRRGEEDSIDSLLRIFKEITVDYPIADLAGRYMNQYMKSHGLTPVDAILAASARMYDIPIYTLNGRHFPMAGIEIVSPY